MSLVEFASLTKDVSFFLLINAKSHHILPLNYFSDPFPFFLWATFYAYACIIPRDQSDLHVLILPLLSTLFSIHQRHSFAMCCFSLALKLFCESLTYMTKYRIVGMACKTPLYGFSVISSPTTFPFHSVMKQLSWNCHIYCFIFTCSIYMISLISFIHHLCSFFSSLPSSPCCSWDQTVKSSIGS